MSGSDRTSANKSLVRQFVNALNRNDIITIRKLIHERHAVQGALRNRTRAGPEAIVGALTRLRTRDPQLHYILEDSIAEDDTVVARWRLTRTGQESPTARNHHEGITMCRIVDGKVVESWTYIRKLGKDDFTGRSAKSKGV